SADRSFSRPAERESASVSPGPAGCAKRSGNQAGRRGGEAYGMSRADRHGKRRCRHGGTKDDRGGTGTGSTGDRAASARPPWAHSGPPADTPAYPTAPLGRRRASRGEPPISRRADSRRNGSRSTGTLRTEPIGGAPRLSARSLGRRAVRRPEPDDV